MFERSIATLDIPYARKVLEHLLAHPEEHNQDVYGERTPCGTKACIAGTAVSMDAQTEVHWDSTGMTGQVTVDGESMTIERRAAELLGLHDYADHMNLFHCYDDAKALSLLKELIVAAEDREEKAGS